MLCFAFWSYFYDLFRVNVYERYDVCVCIYFYCGCSIVLTSSFLHYIAFVPVAKISWWCLCEFISILGSLFCFLDLLVCYIINITLCPSLWLYKDSPSQVVSIIFLTLFFYVEVVILELLHLHINLRISLSVSQSNFLRFRLWLFWIY